MREELEGERNISSIAILLDVLNFMDMLYVNMGKELNIGKYARMWRLTSAGRTR